MTGLVFPLTVWRAIGYMSCSNRIATAKAEIEILRTSKAIPPVE